MIRFCRSVAAAVIVCCLIPVVALSPRSRAAAPPSLSERLEAAAGIMTVPDDLRPPLAEARLYTPEVYRLGCHLPPVVTQLVTCDRGDPDGAVMAVLIGDSHAAQWLPALEPLAKAKGIRLISLTKSGCPVATVTVINSLLGREYTECDVWRQHVFDYVRFMHPDIVITASAHNYVYAGVEDADKEDALLAGLTTSLQQLHDAAGEVTLLSDNPPARDEVPACLLAHLDDAVACTSTRTFATAGRPTAIERAAADAAGVRLVSVDDLVCGPTQCPVILDDLLMYRDHGHLTMFYVEWLTPEFAALLGDPWEG